jgi:poly-gamma-glutamate synthase PgsB/CapB
MTDIWLVVGTIACVTVLGLLEAWTHHRNLANIPIRIHINGTRGKSSVTRLIAAGLREAGVRTCAKTTGTLPRLILPDGSECPIFRPSRPNIIEQVSVVRAAVAYRAEAVVVECMALQPWLQWISEAKLVRATHGVITNVRADHLDVMGPTEYDVACALANTIPIRGKLFTTERTYRHLFRRAAEDRGSLLIPIDMRDVEAVTADELAGFRYVAHPENVALALRVCAHLGIDRQTALCGMWKAQPDPGATTTHEIDFFGRRIVFVNAFAANDPESTGQAWHQSIQRFPDVQTSLALFNCRADRVDRSRQLGTACYAWEPADYYILMGTGTRAFIRAALAAGLDRRRLVLAEGQDAAEIFETMVDLAGKSTLVVGMGNIGGHGLDVVGYFRNRSCVKPLVPQCPKRVIPARIEDVVTLRSVPILAAAVGDSTPHDGHGVSHGGEGPPSGSRDKAPEAVSIIASPLSAKLATAGAPARRKGLVASGAASHDGHPAHNGNRKVST